MNEYKICEDYATVYISYTGKKISPGIYECLVDLDVLQILQVLNRAIYLVINNNQPYAMYKYKGENLYVHHLARPKVPGMDIDHTEGNTLDNRRSKLRVLSRNLNARNTDKHKVSTCGYKWVTKNRNKWAANVRFNMQKQYLGNFSTPLEAHRTANRWVYENIGSEFCCRQSILRGV